MNDNKFKAGAALCPECGSVLEFLFNKCPWCSHEFSPQESMKILSMFAETGVGKEDLLGQLRQVKGESGTDMLPFCEENYEKGGQGSKMASLLVLKEFGDGSGLPVGILKEGYKKSSNNVKKEVLKTLAKAGTPEAEKALAELKEYENDPEVLGSFPRKPGVVPSTQSKPPIAAIPPLPGMKEDEEEEEEEAIVLDDEVIEESEPPGAPAKDQKVEAEALKDAMASIAKGSPSKTATMPLIPGGERRIPSPSPIPPVPVPSSKAGRPSAPPVPGISGSKPPPPSPSVPPAQATPSIPPEDMEEVVQKDSAPPLSALSIPPERPPPETPPLAGSAPDAPMALAETMLAAPGVQAQAGPQPPAAPEAPPRERLPSAQDILPPHAEMEAVYAAQQQPESDPKKKGRKLGIIFIGLGFIIVAAIVLVVLVALGVRIPVGERYQHQLRNLLGGTSETETIAKGDDTSGPVEEEGEEAAPSEGGEEEASEPAEEEGEGEEEGEAEGEEGTQEGEEGEGGEGEEGEEGEEEEEAAAPPITMADVEGKTPQKLSFTIAASSQHKKYPAANMIDGDPTTVWQEDRKLRPTGHTLTITFEKEVIVTGIKVLGGYDDPKGDKGDMWPIHTRLQKVKVKFEGSPAMEVEFDDVREMQTRTFDAPQKTMQMTITVLGVYRGTWFHDNAVAELEVWGFSQ